MSEIKTHQQIKEYPTVHRHNEALTFRAFRTEDHFAEVGGNADVPHRHNFYTVLLIKRGRGTHTIDYNAYSIQSNQLFFVSPGQVHHLVEDECTYGYVLLFSIEFLRDNNIELSFLEDLHLFHDYGESPPLVLSLEQLDTLSAFCEQILAIENTDIKFREQAIGAVLKLFLIHANSYVPGIDEDARLTGSAQELLRRFKSLVDSKYSEWHDAMSFANALGISPDHLNRTIKQLIGKTVKEYIQSRLVVESRRLLAFSSLSAKQISVALGFGEPANFSAFFKKHTGMPPSQFRKDQHPGNS
ncbi:MAG: AraC family transcriptional regulator [Deltaproteobacteria bacterium]|nr:AraC family transcriptional regulator [Deltaproteobacteria bacterium]